MYAGEKGFWKHELFTDVCCEIKQSYKANWQLKDIGGTLIHAVNLSL